MTSDAVLEVGYTASGLTVHDEYSRCAPAVEVTINPLSEYKSLGSKISTLFNNPLYNI